MKQKIKVIMATIIFLTMLIACGKEINKKEKISAREAVFSLEEKYTLLNDAECLKFSIEESEKKQISQVLIKYQRQYTEGTYTGELIPLELVSSLEEALYSYCKFGEDRSDQRYKELLAELGGYRMTEEEIKETFQGDASPYQAFTFQLKNGKRAYLRSFYFEKQRGGDHSLWAESNGEWFREGDFMTMFEEGEVICYEDNYYYVGLEEHYEIVENDRIRIFRLGEGMEWEDNLLIRYVPKDYKRIILSTLVGEGDKELKAYIEGLSEVVTLNRYIAGINDELSIFYGDIEEKILDKETGCEKYSYVDMTNTGVPIYIEKTWHWAGPVNYWNELNVEFYLYDDAEDKFLLLDKWNSHDGYSGPLRREQLWCEEIGEKVYTFQLFRSEDYTYIFEVLLLEGNQEILLQREVWVPQKEMVFIEGEKLSPVM